MPYKIGMLFAGQIVFTAIGAAAGAALKVVWDAVVDRRKEIEKAQWDTRFRSAGSASPTL